MTKFTPTPWKVHWNAKDSCEIVGPRYEIALLNGYVEEVELKANAQLLVTAPDMYEELRACPLPPNIDSFTYRHAMEEWLKVADAWYRDMQRTLAQATGDI